MNGLELVQSAQQMWRVYHGDQGLYGSCQWFDGWYVQWAWMDFQNDWDIITYGSAIEAANDSVMFAWNVNDKSIDAGDLLYWEYSPYGHVCTAVGWDGDRLLVSNTAHGGDSVMYLGNDVKICHADTVDLPFIGASKTNGRNPERTGVTNYGDVALAGDQRQVRSGVEARRRIGAPNTSAPTGDPLPSGTIGNFKGWVYGETVEGNNLWYVGISGDFFWSGSFTEVATHDLADMNSTNPPPAGNQRVVLSSDAANQRTEPKTSAPVQGSIPAGDTGTFDGWIHGDSVDGNDVWFRGAISGLWSWSGGFTDTGTHDLTDLNGLDPDPDPVLDPGYKDRPVDSPLATWVGSPNYNWREPRDAGEAPSHITMHWMDGTLAGTDAQFQKFTEINENGTANGSASSYGIGQTEIHQYVQEKDYHQADGDTYSNRWGLSIEHEGGTSIPITQDVMDASAALLADIATRYGWTGFVAYEDDDFVNLSDDEQAQIVEDHAAEYTTRLVFPHRAWVATQCPGTLDYPAIVEAANELLATDPPPPCDVVPITVEFVEEQIALAEAASELWRGLLP